MSTAVATYRVNYSEHTANHKPLPNQQNRNIQQTGAMPTYGGSSDKCARCSKTVYLAERKLGAGRAFHSSCFSCHTCHRKLASTTLSEHKGEIYCKACYTREFGVHGLANGVTMTTENAARTVRHSRRSSYGNDLDETGAIQQQIRQRAHSNDNTLRGEHSAVHNDELPRIFPWRNDVLPEQIPSEKDVIQTEFKPIVDKTYQRPISQIGFQRVVEMNDYDNSQHRQSNVSNDDDGTQRYKIDHEIPTCPYGASALVDVPVVEPPRYSNSVIEQIQMPILPTRTDEPIRDLPPVSTNTYRRESSREQVFDITDKFAHSTMNDAEWDVKNDHKITDAVATVNPIVIKPSHPGTSSPSNEQTPSDINKVHPSPSSNTMPHPTFSSTNVYDDTVARASASSHYHDSKTQPSNSNVVDYRYSSSSQQNEHTKSALYEFVSTTNLPISPASEKYPTLAALMQPLRPVAQFRSSSNNDVLN